MKNENRNEEAVSPVIATILMVAITVVLAGVLYVWASSLAEGNTGDGIVFRQFTGEDAQGTPGAGTDDALVYVTMSQGDSPIDWAYVKVSISVDDGPVKECANAQAGADATNDCAISGDGETGDNEWSVGDEIIISENGQGLCSGACSITVVLYDTNAGKEMQTIQNIAVS